MAKTLCVGIDIGAHSVKVCEVQQVRGTTQLKKFASFEVPPDTIADGSPLRPTIISEGLKKIFRDYKIRNKNVSFAVSGNSIITKVLPLPFMQKDQIEEAIQFEASRHIPFDIRDVYLDATPIDAEIWNKSGMNPAEMQVALVAAKKDYVDSFAAIIHESGLRPLVCDVTPFSMETMFLQNYAVAENDCVALVDIGAEKTNLNILLGSQSLYTRHLSIGGKTFTQEIERNLKIPFLEAETLKLGGKGQAEDGHMIPQEVQRSLVLVSETLANELQRSIDYFTASTGREGPSRMYICGGNAKLNLLTRILSANIRISVDVIDPFRNIDISGFERAFIQGIGPSAGVAMGLALRSPGDNHA